MDGGGPWDGQLLADDVDEVDDEREEACEVVGGVHGLDATMVVFLEREVTEWAGQWTHRGDLLRVGGC